MIRENVCGVEIVLNTTDKLFSPCAVDRGTRAMLSVCAFAPGMRVHDLGCGAGVVGIVAAKTCGEENVLMSDISEEAVRVAAQNAKDNGVRVRAVVSDGYAHIEDAGFDLILVNPPYQSDFSVAKRFIEKGFNRLKLGGKMTLVVKRRTWYENKLRSVFGGCQVQSIDGYYVFTAVRRTAQRANSVSAAHNATT